MIFALIVSSRTNVRQAQSKTLVSGGYMEQHTRKHNYQTRFTAGCKTPATDLASLPSDTAEPQKRKKSHGRRVIPIHQLSPDEYQTIFKQIRSGVTGQIAIPNIGAVTISRGPWSKNNPRAAFVNVRNNNYPDAEGEKYLDYVRIMLVLSSHPNPRELARFMLTVLNTKQASYDFFTTNPYLFDQNRKKIAIFKQALAMFLSLALFAERKRERSATLSFTQYLERVQTGAVGFNIQTLNEYVPITIKTKLGVEAAQVNIDNQQRELAATGASTPQIKAYAREALSTAKRDAFVQETRAYREDSKTKGSGSIAKNLFTEFNDADADADENYATTNQETRQKSIMVM